MSETVQFVAGFKGSDSTQQLILPLSTKSVTNGKTHSSHADLSSKAPENGAATNSTNPYYESTEVSILYNASITPVDCSNPPLETDLQELEEQEDSDEEMLPCGLGKWFSPAWLQPLASKQMFLAVYCLTCVLQGMYYTYFVSVLTTIEKLFQIQSKTTGIIMSATEIGQIGGSLLLTYYGGQGHRPKWIGWGMVLFGLSSLICSLPHFLFGATQTETPIHFAENNLVCKPHSDNSSQVFWAWNRTSSDVERGNWSEIIASSPAAEAWSEEGECRDMGKQQSQSRTTQIALSVFFVSLVGIGLGQTAVYTLGMTYIDDNVANRESPTYFAITIGVRILGPVFGFLLGAACTSLYVDPLADVNITTMDPGWIGAWWLGMVLVSALIFISSLAMFSFPRRLPNPNCKEQGTIAAITLRRQEFSPKRNPSLKDFPKAVRRLLKNDILLLRTASSVLHILPIAGLYTFLPKYLESQFRLTAHVANMISAMGGILVMGIGISLSGVFIRKMKPNPKFVAAWLASAALLYAFGMGILMLIGCSMDDFVGLKDTEHGKKLELPCNRTCDCDPHTFAPVCSGGSTYFSACHAGCTQIDTGAFTYSKCQCLLEDAIATTGYCPLACPNFLWYIGLFSLFVLIHSTSEVGSLLLTLRCVDPKDKAMALGLIQFAIGLFGNVPCPIIYGAVVDSACLVWKMTCGEQGACSLYDATVFRFFFHGTTGGLMLLAFLVDVVVWWKADKISFASGDCSGEVEEELQPMRLSSRHKMIR